MFSIWTSLKFCRLVNSNVQPFSIRHQKLVPKEGALKMYSCRKSFIIDLLFSTLPVLFGEDVAFGGVFRCSVGLKEKYGKLYILIPANYNSFKL